MLEKRKSRHLPAVCVLFSLISVATAADRVQPSQEVIDAYEAGDFARSLVLVSKELHMCQAANPQADECLDLLFGGMNMAYKTQEFTRAEKLARAAVEIAIVVFGEQHADTAKSYNTLAFYLNVQGHYDEAEPLFRKALDIREAMLGEQHANTSMSYNNLASNLNKQGHFDEAEALYRKALKVDRSVYGEQHSNTVTSYINLAIFLKVQGRYDEAKPLYRKALEIRQATLGEQHVDTAMSYDNLASILGAQGRYDEAEPLLRKALEIRQTVLGEQHRITARSYNNLAHILNEQSHYDEAELMLRKALEIDLGVLGGQHPQTASAYDNLAVVLDLQGRYLDALPLLLKALEIRLAALGESHRETAVSYNNLAMNLQAQGLYENALPLFRKALEINQAVWGERHPDTAVSYSNLVFNLERQGRYEEAEPLSRMALEINLRVLGERHPDTARSYIIMAAILNFQGRSDRAESFYRKALEIRQAVLGEAHPDTAYSYRSLSSFYADRGRATEALSYARRAVSVVRRQQYQSEQARAGKFSGGNENIKSRHIYAALIKASWLSSQDLDSADTADALMNESFAAAQDLLANGTEAAVTQMAARFAAGDDGLAQLSRQHQDTARELMATDSLILTAWGGGNTEQAETLKGRSESLTEQLAVLSSDLRDRYPSYAELVLPKPLSVVETQASLLDGQGLLLIVPWGDHAYVFALTADAAKWQRVDLNWRELSRRVARLRCDVDPVTCSKEGADGTRAGASAYGQSVSQGLRPFDRSTAYSLYKDVLRPVMDVFADIDTLSVVTSGPLSGIPLSILVTEEPGAGEDDADPEVLRNTAWLGDRFALMSLPSVSSLKSLGGLDASSDGKREIFVGIGDPLLGGELVAGVSRSGLDQYFRGVSDAGTALANPDSLRQLASLPGTRSELEAMARALGATEESLLLGGAATETAVKARSLSTEVLTFATHGLIAGELRGLGEPGLVLTPPEVATEHDDGILTASEIARLDMDVEWLILSACNTASADGTPGAEGLSGLARAFLYAGARSLLVSHWRVRDDVTAKLTVAAIEGSENQSRSKSLQQAMRSIRTGTDENGEAISGWDPSWSHPAAWAPFSLVGARQ